MRLSRSPLLLALAALSLPLVLTTDAASYLVRTVTAVLAVLALVRWSGPSTRRAQRLLAGSLGMGIASGLTATAHVTLTGSVSPAGALADWLYLGYAPLAVAGILALPRPAAVGPWRAKALADATVAVGSLAFVLAPLMVALVHAGTGSRRATAAALGYPALAVFVLAVVLSALPRVAPEQRPFLRVAGTGFALLTLGDIGYSVAILDGTYRPTSLLVLLMQGGLLLVLFAPLTTESAHTGRLSVPAVAGPVETAAPYLPLLGVAAVLAVLLAHGERPTEAQTVLGLVLALGVITRQVLSNDEHRQAVLSLLARERQANELALRDPLTGLANRIRLHLALDDLLTQKLAEPVCLALLDLDDFKVINDTHGHDTGDEVLREVGLRLQRSAPVGAVVARLGGDEFAVCLRSAEPAELGTRLVGALATPITVGRRDFTVTASIGVVLADAGAANALSHVDVAMYQAKSVKAPQRSRVVVLSGASREAATARVQLRDDISRPDLSQFRVVYEPMVDLATGALVGAEALLRWDHPTLGAVEPGEFIPLAETVGSIHALGELCLRSAVADLAGWLRTAQEQGEPLGTASVGVNLSPRQLGSLDLCDVVRDVLAEHQLPPYRLVLEITEQALMDDWATAVDVVRELRAMGVAVAVDDFGTGYSSLRYLRRFDTSTVKIDREFVQALPDEERTRALVASVLDMARALGLYTVAEGIETLDQLQVLRTLGCRFAQGYLFDRPMSATAFGDLLLARHTYPMAELPRTAALVPPPREWSGAGEVMPSPLPVIARRHG